MQHTVNPSPTQYPLEDYFRRWKMPPVLLYVMRFLIPTLLPVGDESAMNFEGLGVPLGHIYCLSQHFLRVGSYLRR